MCTILTCKKLHFIIIFKHPAYDMFGFLLNLNFDFLSVWLFLFFMYIIIILMN